MATSFLTPSAVLQAAAKNHGHDKQAFHDHNPRLQNVAYIGKTARNRGRRRHCGTYQMGSPARP
jgi:hypothetical protein